MFHDSPPPPRVCRATPPCTTRGRGRDKSPRARARAIRPKTGLHPCIKPVRTQFSTHFRRGGGGGSTHFSRLWPPLSPPDRFEERRRGEGEGGKGFLSKKICARPVIGLGASNRRCNLGLGNVV